MTERMITLDGGETCTLDRHGFLDPPDQWSEAFAEAMASRAGIHGGMTKEHWNFVHYLRKKFIEEETVPVVVLACADNNIRLGKLRALFPAGYHRGACKIAGIDYQFMYEHNIWLTYESYRMLKANYKMTATDFLDDYQRWDRQFAHLIVTEWGFPDGLNDSHWEVIKYLREFYAENQNIPAVVETVKALDITLSDLNELFPEGYRRGACRIAGLPFFA